MRTITRFSLVVCILLSVIYLPVHGQYLPPDGSTGVTTFYSPSFLAGFPSIMSLESPQADALNPAAAGLKQQITLDLGYLALIDFGGEGWGGHIVNIGSTHPTKVGVFTWSGHFMSSSLTDVSLGTFGSAKVSFAKDLYPNLLIGLGLNGTIGQNGANDWSVTGDLGFIHFLDHAKLDNLRWGIVLKDLGKGFSPVEGRTSYPPVFTPIVGTGFTLLDSEKIDINIVSDVSMPSFQNLKIGVGADFTILDTVGIQFSTYLDAAEIFNADLAMKSFIPSFGLSFSFQTDIKKESDILNLAERGWGKSEIKTQIAAGPLQGSTWGIGVGVNAPLGVIDSNPPEISIAFEGEAYISPNLDGILDDIVFPISIVDERYVTGYSFKILDSTGAMVREIRNKDERPENEGFKSVMDRLTAVKKGITVPEKIRWDGMGDDGSVVPDGIYSALLDAWDDNGNIGTSERPTVVVDNTAPEIVIEQPEALERIFSPNADGNKDIITIRQEGSEEDLWTGLLTDSAGNVVRTFSWMNGAPREFSWDGKDDEEVLAPDGVYSYRISSTDRAGNRGSGSLENIIINTRVTPISMSISDSYFSPNGDGVKDTITAYLNIPVKEGIVSWGLSILNESGDTVLTRSGGSDIPEDIVFDGKGRDGSYLPEGSYSGALKVSYLNGNRPEAVSPSFTLDTTPPQASVRTDLGVFSPNGDGNKDIISIFQDTSAEDNWTGTIIGINGETVKTFEWIKTADPKIEWDGRGRTGRVMPDGQYSYILTAVDRAGNRGSSNKVDFTLNTEETPVFLTTDVDYFSPNSDGSMDSIEILPQLKITEGVESYELRVTDMNGAVVRTFDGRGALTESYRWDGLDNSGRRAPDGSYRSEIRIRYRNGNTPTAQSKMFTIDTQYPQVSVSSDLKLFSPNGDGKKDTVTFFHTTSSEDLWEGKIVDAKGQLIRSIFWKGAATTFVWDGSDEFGNPVSDGIYSYTVSSMDKAGNYAEESITGLEVDTKINQVFVTVAEEGFSPNGDGLFEDVNFTVVVNETAGFVRWDFKVVRTDGTVEKTFGGELLPSKIVWNGVGDSGRVVEGTYRGTFTAVYEKGDEPQASTNQFYLDVTPPEVRVSLRPAIFSPDNDGVDDELFISFDVKDQSGIKDWSFVIKDPKGNAFIDFRGEGVPTSTFIWDGRSKTGELVLAAEDYPYTMTVKDRLGNSRTVEGKIPIDVLVFRDGDRLKIRISNINFAPNSPLFQVDDPDILEKNEWVISRIADIFQKYSRYNIRIEGHAVSVYWDDAERAKTEQETELIPLSEARAQTVKDALVKYGIDPNRITVKGIGGSEPIVPHGDLENRWKNRRVEFILIR